MKSHLDAKKTEQDVAKNKRTKYGESDAMKRILPHRKAKEKNIKPTVKNGILGATDFKKTSANKARHDSQPRQPGCSGNGDTRALKTNETCVTPRKPPKFSFVVEGLVAGHGRPTKPGHIEYLVQCNFKYIVTLTENKPRALEQYPGTGLEWVHIPVKDETAPSVEQIHEFVELIYTAQAQNVAVSVHCAWGRGRTGTMLACFLARHMSLDPAAAITTIRERRPGSIDTTKQEQAVHDYVATLT